MSMREPIGWLLGQFPYTTMTAEFDTLYLWNIKHDIRNSRNTEGF
jgi:hypothetical protein